MRLGIEERRKKEKELWEEGKTQSEIARELNVSEGTISRDIKYLRGQKENKGESISLKSIKRLCDNFYGQERTKQKFKQYILNCKDRFKNDLLKKDEIPIIKDVVELTDKYQDSVFYLKVCIRFGRVEEAMKFVNTQIHKEAFTKEEQDKLRGLKEQIQQIKKEYIAIGILKKQQGVEEAVKRSGLPETTVIELNRQLLQKAQEGRKKEENDEGEEPQI